MAIDLVALANKIKGQQAATPSLVPTTSLNYADLLPARPEYKPYTKQEFDPTVPMSDRPAGTENWMWSKSTAQREAFEQAEQAKADERFRQYQTELAGWQDAVNLAKAEDDRRRQDLKNYNEHLSAQGLTPAVSLYDPSPVIRQAQSEWQKAQAAGNKQAMDYWHNVAEQARIGAGWGSGGTDGSLTAGRLTAAGLPTWERQYKETAYNDALKQQDLENALALTKMTAKGGGSGSGGGSLGSPDDFPYFLDTQGERTNVMTGSLLERAEAQYQLNRQRGGSAGKYPLYYALNTLFNNPEWQRAATSSGADIKKVADYLIVKYAKMSPVDYFAAGKASGTPVAAAYKQLLTQEEQDRFYSPVATGKKQSSKGSFLNIFK